MSLIIPDEFLQAAKLSEADFKLEIAILLYQQNKINLLTASQFATVNSLEFQRIVMDRQTPIHNAQSAPQNTASEVNNLVQSPPTQAEILQRIEQRRTFSPAQHRLPNTLTLLQEDRAR